MVNTLNCKIKISNKEVVFFFMIVILSWFQAKVSDIVLYTTYLIPYKVI